MTKKEIGGVGENVTVYSDTHEYDITKNSNNNIFLNSNKPAKKNPDSPIWRATGVALFALIGIGSGLAAIHIVLGLKYSGYKINKIGFWSGIASGSAAIVTTTLLLGPLWHHCLCPHKEKLTADEDFTDF